MYTLKTENSFNSAHFLAGYEGKCSNIHGHRWRVIIEIKSSRLKNDKQTKGMVDDFSTFKENVRKETDFYDHALVIEKNTLKPATLAALKDEGIKMIELDFRPTAENFAKLFYDRFKTLGYDVKKATVYETPNNCATYSEE